MHAFLWAQGSVPCYFNILAHELHTMNKPSCVLHLGGKTSETVKLFDDKTWEKVQTVNKARHEKLSNSKYFEINLPNVFNEAIGYHSKCYRNFTSISMPLCSGKSKISDGKSHLLR